MESNCIQLLHNIQENLAYVCGYARS